MQLKAGENTIVNSLKDESLSELAAGCQPVVGQQRAVGLGYDYWSLWGLDTGRED